MLQLVSVTKTYDGRPALDDVTLSFRAGRTSVLIGPSGCGKSTVFGLLTGLLRPDAGDVRFEGQPVSPPRLPAIRRRIGYVIQDGGLFPRLTGDTNVTLMARHTGWPRDAIRRRVEELSTLTRLSRDTLARYPSELSGGQRQRVSLMRALMLDPDVLLLDEPLGALDPMVRSELQDDLAAIFRRLGKTVVLVTHDLREAAFFGDHIVLMRDGRVVQQGAFDDFLHQPADPFVTAFVQAQQQRVRAAG